MARKKDKTKPLTFSVFNVSYEDGTLSSNRRVENQYLDQSFGDSLIDLARIAIAEQDREIEQRSNKRRAKIKSIEHVKQ